MTVPGNLSSPLLATAADAAAAAAVTTRSIRLNSGDSANLSRTPSSASNRKTWTWSGWYKPTVSGGNFRRLFGSGDTYLIHSGTGGSAAADTLYVNLRGGATNYAVSYAPVFRDFSAWYHIVWAVDTTQATAADRSKFYVNGVQITEAGGAGQTYPPQNHDTAVNSTGAHYISSSSGYVDGYMTDIYLIDGSQLDPTSFGAFDSNNVWQAAAYSGTFGTNGFHLKFDDASSNAALGTDSSGNDNTWTVNNITAKASGKKGSVQNFQVVTYTGTNASKSISLPFKPDFIWTKSRSRTDNHGLHDSVRGRAANLYSDQTYVENTSSASADLVSFDTNGYTLGTVEQTAMNRSGETYVAWCWNAGDNSDKTYTVKVVSDSGNKYRFDDFGTSAVTLDLAEGSTYVFDQSDSSNSGHPLRFSTTSDGTHNSGTEYTTGVTTTGTPGSAGAKTTIVVAASAPTLYYYCSSHSGMGGQANTNNTEGASNFDGSIQAKVKANQDFGFSVVTYSGTGSNASFGHGLGATPKMVWIKDRDTAYDWRVHHESFSTGYDAQLNQQSAASSASTVYRAAPTSSVVNIGTGTAVNGSSDTYVAYCWSEISGFSKISTYTGTGSSQTIDCGFKPKFVLLKNNSVSNDNWYIFDSERLPNTVWANGSNAESSSYSAYFTGFTDSGFTVTGSNQNTNKSGDTYIFMAFAATPPGENDDSLFDVPTNGTQSDTGAGGEVSGNYAVMNALDKEGSLTLSNGNLDVSNTANSLRNSRATIAYPATGKWYYEYTPGGSANMAIGIADSSTSLSAENSGTFVTYHQDGAKNVNGTKTASAFSSYTAGDVIGVMYDSGSNSVTFYKNNSSQGSVTPTSGKTYFPFIITYNTTGSFNFGARAFAYTAPSSAKALCTTNLPTATVPDGSDYFDITLYTGNGSTQTISGLGFSPDFVWTKLRGPETDYGHRLADIVRGTGKVMYSNNTSTEANETGISAFNSDGYTLGSAAGMNKSSSTFVSWAWDAGSSTASNTDGTITSSVRANQTAGFSIVSYTGNGTAGATVGHGLNAEPSLVIAKCRESAAATNWAVYHKLVGGTHGAYLDTTGAFDDSAGYWNDTNPTSSVVTLGNFAVTNANNVDLIMYAFAPVANYSQFSSYTGNGSADGPFVHTGFRPALIIFRNTGGPHIWGMYDSTRDTYNVADLFLRANGADAEGTAVGVDFLSNGFKIRGSQGFYNQSGATILYMAWAENPFQANGGLAR